MKDIKTHYINFRLTDAEWQKIEAAAEASGEENVNEWSRKQMLSQLTETVNLTRNERAIFEEIARTRMMILHGFMLLAEQKLTGAEWKEIIDLTGKHGSKIGDRFLVQQGSGGT